MAKRIGLFGGTFDPVHKGHQSIAEAFLNSGFIDELWVLLTPYPPHKQTGNKASYEVRLEMLKAAFVGFKNLHIKTIENSLSKPSYSFFTIRYLKSQNPEYTFYFCMGEDSLAQFHQWKFYEEILNECALLVAERPGADHKDVEQKITEKTYFVEHTPLEVSSSHIKQKIKSGKPIDNDVPDSVSDIIEKEQLYS
ncbi:MAG: nicotinate (nicotinamide) nucleotide adenylyltransferase [Balneolaceae bacterium]